MADNGLITPTQQPGDLVPRQSTPLRLHAARFPIVETVRQDDVLPAVRVTGVHERNSEWLADSFFTPAKLPPESMSNRDKKRKATAPHSTTTGGPVLGGETKPYPSHPLLRYAGSSLAPSKSPFFTTRTTGSVREVGVRERETLVR
ncbi:predicted protein [Coccidioides posadasii str. Silveira]|uniref:Predicted protein n=2 Tax=Coccidioides posadasii TaxID=199306 RepID=E9CR07_COCPS|nr:predicted protein [Coccidioides posadasii str. Silveira]KMM64113.1 hypothetical protein CPAG_00465 [Coccidioides posadasii RMSCC 3488]